MSEDGFPASKRKILFGFPLVVKALNEAVNVSVPRLNLVLSFCSD